MKFMKIKSRNGMVWTNEVTTQIRSKNHKYSALTCKDQSYYQSMSSKFRYGDRKVLGTNPTRPVGQLPVIVSYFLISLKTHLTLLSILTHTHQHTSSNQHGINHPKTLTYIYHGNSHQAQHTFIMHIISSHPMQQTTRYHKGRNIDMATSKKHVIAF